MERWIEDRIERPYFFAWLRNASQAAGPQLPIENPQGVQVPPVMRLMLHGAELPTGGALSDAERVLFFSSTAVPSSDPLNVNLPSGVMVHVPGSSVYVHGPPTTRPDGAGADALASASAGEAGADELAAGADAVDAEAVGPDDVGVGLEEPPQPVSEAMSAALNESTRMRIDMRGRYCNRVQT